MAPGHWRVRIFERDATRNDVYAWLGEEPPTPSGGGGGHEQVKRPRRDPVLVWRGRDSLMTLTVPILLDGFIDDEPVIAARQTLVNMWRPDDPDREPPVVRIDSKGDAVPFQQLEYVVTDLVWTGVQANADMERTQQGFTVTLTEYQPDEFLVARHTSAAKERARKRKRGKGGSKTPATYTVKSGDTLSGIAARYHVKGGWRAIAAVQRPPITDPRALRVGQRLRMPS